MAEESTMPPLDAVPLETKAFQEPDPAPRDGLETHTVTESLVGESWTLPSIGGNDPTLNADEVLDSDDEQVYGTLADARPWAGHQALWNLVPDPPMPIGDWEAPY